MKRIAIVFILLVFLHPLFSDGLDVLSSNEEITAYKHMNIPVEPEEPQTPPSDPTSITFSIIDPSTNSEIGTGESKKLTNSVLTDATYQQNSHYGNVIAWSMTGDEFKKSINISFTFGPLTSETVAFSNSMTVSDKTKVIPYTVTLSSNSTTVEGIGTIGTDKIDKNNYNNSTNRDKYYQTTVSSGFTTTTYYVYCADSLTYSNNGAQVTTSSATVVLTCNMYNNSYAKKSNNSTQDQRSNINKCNTWTRTGVISLDLGLNDNGYSWSETVNGESVTYKLERGSATYTANVVVAITVN